MLRDPFVDREDKKYSALPLIIEGAKEMQQFARALPQTEDLPSDEEHYITHRIERRNERDITLIEIGVRKKSGGAVPHAPDGLNDMDEGSLEDLAARRGLDVAAWKKLPSKSKRIKAIRDAKAVCEV